MRILLFTLVIICFCSMGSAGSIEVTTTPKTANQYAPITFDITLPVSFKNPNDAEKVKVDVKLTGPDGANLTMSAFCINKRTWQARFTPIKEGGYKYYVEVISGKLNEKTGLFNLDVAKSEGNGFLRRSKNNSYYLVFDSGAPFFGIGHNVAWTGTGTASSFDRYFLRLNKNRCNLARVWFSDWSLPLEWGKIGEYNKTTSEEMDRILTSAAKKNIYVILCFDTYGSLMEEKGPWDENKWQNHLYNKKNGGPCESPKDFFTNPDAKRWYKNRLRYIVSRWGWSTNILAFELWNEYNAPADWIKEMAGYIKSIDPHGHLVTTSFGYPWEEIYDDSKAWELSEVDIVSKHSYGTAEEAGLVVRLTQEAKETADRFKKPFVFAEVGIDASKDDKIYDPEFEGIALHNSIWALAMSKSFATAMNWWWDSYLKDERLYSHYAALAEFLSGTNWNASSVENADKGLVMVKNGARDKRSAADVAIKTRDRWGKIYINEFTILNNGDIVAGGVPCKYLHGAAKAEMKADHVFNVEYPTNGKFIVRIGIVSQGGYLHVFLDDEEVAAKEFPAGPGEGPWKKSLYLKKYDVYQCVYNEPFEVDVPKGRHTIRLTNEGKDWIGVEEIRLTNYFDNTFANARCLGLKLGERMLFWIQNKDSNWRNTFYKKRIDPIKNAYFIISNAADGAYEIEWWDTYKGILVSNGTAVAKEGLLNIDIPDFERDIACKVQKSQQ